MVMFGMLNDPDPVNALIVMKTMLQMEKIDIKTLKQAYDAASLITFPVL